MGNFPHVTRAIYLIGIGHMGKIARPTEVQLPAVNKAWRIFAWAICRNHFLPCRSVMAASCNINTPVTVTHQASSVNCDIVFKRPQDHNKSSSVISQSREFLSWLSHLHFKNKLIWTALHLWNPQTAKLSHCCSGDVCKLIECWPCALCVSKLQD